MTVVDRRDSVTKAIGAIQNLEAMVETLDVNDMRDWAHRPSKSIDHEWEQQVRFSIEFGSDSDPIVRAYLLSGRARERAEILGMQTDEARHFESAVLEKALSLIQPIVSWNHLCEVI